MQFIFEELTKSIIFLDISLKINNKLHFDVYHETTNSFRYLHYKSYPPHTKNNIALSLAICIVRVVTDNTNNWSSGHLLKGKHLEKIIDYSFTKLFQPRKHGHNGKNVITFTRTYNPNHHFSFNKFKNCIKNTRNRELQKAFNDKKILLTTRQPKKLRNLLLRAKFETKTILKSPKLTGLFLCSNCVYHKAGYIIPCSSFSFKLTNGKTITWTCQNYFSCDSKDIIYILI